MVEPAASSRWSRWGKLAVTAAMLCALVGAAPLALHAVATSRLLAVPAAFAAPVGAAVPGSAVAATQGPLASDTIASVLAPGAGGFIGVPPFRLVDTRASVQTNGSPVYGGPAFTAGEVDTFQVYAPGDQGLPAGGIGAVVLNVTVVDPMGDGYVAVWPAGTDRPATSVLNYAKGEVVANAVTVALSADLRFSVSTFTASHLVVDVVGVYAATANGPGGGGFQGVAPVRKIDTRLAGQSTASVPTSSGGRLISGLDISGQGVPADAVAVVLNVTAVPPAHGTSGFVTVFPSATAMPTTSNVNYDGRHVVANQVTVAVTAGKVDIYAMSAVDIVVDVMGYYAPGPVIAGGFTSIPPTRFMDTRGPNSALWFFDDVTKTYVVDVIDVATVPHVAAAGTFNVTATNTAGPGFVTVFPDGGGMPASSSLNYTKGVTVPNAVTVALGQTGGIELSSYAKADLIVDMSGWFSSPFA